MRERPPVIKEIIEVDANIAAAKAARTDGALPFALAALLKRKRELVRHAASIWGHSAKRDDNGRTRS